MQNGYVFIHSLNTSISNKKPGEKLTADEIESISVNGIPRFVPRENYSENFGYQWNKWDSLLSDSRNTDHLGAKFKLIQSRTHFSELETEKKTVLECGCGGGDDTEALLKFPFSEVHSFDLSTAVDRLKKFINDPRLKVCQASIYDIPYEDRSFDFVFCHRVLQHTPDPELALREVSKKVKMNGHLFVHSYQKSKAYMKGYKYKYRWLTKRLPMKAIEKYCELFARPFHNLNSLLHRNRYLAEISRRFVPFEYYKEFGNFSKEQLIELEKLVTFDALTPTYDSPMKWETMESILREEGFEILFARNNRPISPIFCTAKRVR